MMIVKRYIQDDLTRLQRLYDASMSGPDRAIPIYFSKLGVLELSGWVEESFDAIALRAAKSRIKSDKFKRRVRDAIKKNNGFSYDNNFLGMMAKIVGLSECEQLEQHLELGGKLSVLTGELDAVLNQRRTAAHVSLARSSTAYDSPSVSLGRLKSIHPIIKDIYHWFCRRS